MSTEVLVPITTKRAFYEEKRRRLPWYIASVAVNGLFCIFTVFGCVFTFFLDSLGMDYSQIGFLQSLFPLFGLLALFIARPVARVGVKRTFLAMNLARSLSVFFLIFAPWVLHRFGTEAAFFLLACVLGMFAIFRAIGETAFYPWDQEIVPNEVRGRVAGINLVIGGAVSLIAMGIISYALKAANGDVAGSIQESLGETVSTTVESSRLYVYQGLITVGVAFGILSTLLATRCPGGRPAASRDGEPTHYDAMMKALRDKNFVLFLGGLGVSSFCGSALTIFLPLYMNKEVGLSKSEAAFLYIPTTIGMWLSGVVMGWLADRRSGKLVLLIGQGISAFVLVGWCLVPKYSSASFPLAVCIYCIQGSAGAACLVGFQRLLYNQIVPEEKKTEYMAVYYAWTGVVGFFGMVFFGKLINYFKGMEGGFLFFELNEFVPMFLTAMLLSLLSIVLYSFVKSDHSTT